MITSRTRRLVAGFAGIVLCAAVPVDDVDGQLHQRDLAGEDGGRLRGPRRGGGRGQDGGEEHKLRHRILIR